MEVAFDWVVTSEGALICTYEDGAFVLRDDDGKVITAVPYPDLNPDAEYHVTIKSVNGERQLVVDEVLV